MEQIWNAFGSSVMDGGLILVSLQVMWTHRHLLYYYMRPLSSKKQEMIDTNLVPISLIPNWCPYSINEIQKSISICNSKECKITCLSCKKERTRSFDCALREIRKGTFTSLCNNCVKKVEANSKRDIQLNPNLISYNKTIPEWIESDIPDWARNTILNNPKIFERFKNFHNSELYYEGNRWIIKTYCIQCDCILRKMYSDVHTGIRKKQFTCMCKSCISKGLLADYKIKNRITSYINKQGYKFIPLYCVPEEKQNLVKDCTKYIFEHRYVMSVYLNRPLLQEENVHHINGDRLDNRLENLELWNTSQPAGQKIEDKIQYAMTILKQYLPSALAGHVDDPVNPLTLDQTSQY